MWEDLHRIKSSRAVYYKSDVSVVKSEMFVGLRAHRLARLRRSDRCDVFVHANASDLVVFVPEEFRDLF